MLGEPAMDWSHLDLNPKVVAAVKRANIQTMKEILCLSGPDLQRLTKLSSSDVQYLHKTVAATIKSDPVVTALQIFNGECPFPTQKRKLSMGCPVMDSLLGGGIPLMGITEIVGESSAGKTQICMQLSLSVQFPCSYGGQDAGAVYICTEDTFPNKRLQELIAFQSMLRTDVPPDVVNNIKFGNNIFIEHVADVESLNHCISKRLPILLSRGLIRLVVIDSIAALFRCEFGVSDSIAKAKYLQKIGAMLHHLSHQFSSPVICINQIADVVNDSHLAQGNFGLLDKKVLPALGVTWSNQLLMRLMVSRTQLCVEGKFPDNKACILNSGTVLRRMEIIFAPHLPQSFCNYIICKEGVRGIRKIGL
ncbi:DNA repair protein XRCC3 isoform X1 [Hemiscyllium ocellatum]|uniref:DNA repair protein XRCC3 isoform X1 n=1 Tax=Hemiscyllium ocellatum TaxID=170820 RepID=UPI0029675D0E|nr:DNA repair protein XRCC3 isoform X1 [Hemiscyllium ocellatum]